MHGLLELDADERAAVLAHGPWPPRREPDRSNRLERRAAVIALGRGLFFDATLSGGAQIACAGCHRPERGFHDSRPVAEGRGRGVRNTPALFDVVDRRWFGWDGARDSLWAASLAPMLDPLEMDTSIDRIAAVWRGDLQRAARYRAAFGAVPPDDDEALVVSLAKALAAWQATLRSPRSSFDAFRDALARGDRVAAARYPLSAQRGLKLFIGKGRCNVCHAGPSFTNDEFADIGRPFFVPAGGVDPGRHGGLAKLRESRFNRLGRFNDAGASGPGDPRAVLTRHLVVEHRHFGEFRVPPLRGVSRTAPYMHDGSLETLHDVVRHYSEIDEDRLHADGQRILRRLGLAPQEIDDLVAFLRTL